MDVFLVCNCKRFIFFFNTFVSFSKLYKHLNNIKILVNTKVNEKNRYILLQKEKILLRLFSL